MATTPELLRKIASARSEQKALALACLAIDETLTERMSSVLDTGFYFNRHPLSLSDKAELACALGCIPRACIDPIKACDELNLQEKLALSDIDIAKIRLAAHGTDTKAEELWKASNRLQQLKGVLLLLQSELMQCTWGKGHPPPLEP